MDSESLPGMQPVSTSEITVRIFSSSDIKDLADIVDEAWNYYVQSVERSRIEELLNFYLGDDTTNFWLAFEGDNPVGVAQVVIRESFRNSGEEGRLELLFIRDTASNYYDVHSALMESVFSYLKSEKIEYLRIDTTLENANILII
jgi:hypothetical protein